MLNAAENPGLTISLVIPAHNEEARIGRCLHDAIAHSGGRFREVVVVDNASTDATAAIARSYPGVVVLSEPVKGLPRARQRGFEHTSGEIVAFLDADTRLPMGWVERVEACFAARADVVSLSGPATYYDAGLVQRSALGLGWALTAPVAYRIVGYMIYGAHFAVRRAAVEEIGGFDTSITFYGEDTDLARRLARKGRVVFAMILRSPHRRDASARRASWRRWSATD